MSAGSVQAPRERPRVVIVGGGFAGLSAARVLKQAPVDVLLLDRTNHHLFQPLLCQVATSVLAATDITVPIRWALREQRNTRVLMADVREVDVTRRVVRVDDERREIPWDYLVLAAGARHSYFGHDAWEQVAPGLKSVDDALHIRNRFLLAFERAEKTTDDAERRALQTFVIVGGGPTGVELAGMLPTIATRTMKHEFRTIDPAQTRVILVEGGPRILPTFPEELATRARHDLEKLGVQVWTRSIVTSVDDRGVNMGDERLEARTVFWAAGNAASPLGRLLGVPVDRAGRVTVLPDLSIPGHPEVFVVGDLAVATSDGAPVPAVAPAANQQGTQAARNIMRTIAGEPRQPFAYRDKGNLATIGREYAVADFGRFRLTGRLAWWFWLFVHIMYLAGFRNRVSVLVEWAYAFLSYQRGSRLITGGRVATAEQRERQASV